MLREGLSVANLGVRYLTALVLRRVREELFMVAPLIFPLSKKGLVLLIHLRGLHLRDHLKVWRL